MNFIKGSATMFDIGSFTIQCFYEWYVFFRNSCNYYSYADDNFVSRSSPDVNVILSYLKNDVQISLKISLKLYANNGMKANPSKFKSMIMSSENI